MTKRKGVSPEQRAQELLDQMQITDVPVPVEKIARAQGAVVRHSALDDELSGMIYIQDGQPIIGVNALHHPNRQRFTIAHEIGHLVMHSHLLTGEVHVDKEFRMGVLNRDGKATLGSDLIEIQANRFAAALLAPRAFMEQALADKSSDIDEEVPLDALSRKLRVSKQMLEYRIKNLYAA